MHYDLYSVPWERPSIDKALETGKPALTARFVLTQHTVEDGYSSLLYHPGVKLPEDEFLGERHDMALIIFTWNLFLQHAAPSNGEPMTVILYDKTTAVIESDSPQFLGGVTINNNEVVILKEIELADLHATHLYFEQDHYIGQRIWTTVVIPIDGTYQENLTVVYIGGALIFLASILLAAWMIHNMKRSIQLHQILSKAAAEASIVSSLFPASIRDRMIQDAEARFNPKGAKFDNDIFHVDGNGDRNHLSEERLKKLMTSEGLFGSKPIAELHPYTTLMYVSPS